MAKLGLSLLVQCRLVRSINPLNDRQAWQAANILENGMTGKFSQSHIHMTLTSSPCKVTDDCAWVAGPLSLSRAPSARPSGASAAWTSVTWRTSMTTSCPFWGRPAPQSRFHYPTAGSASPCYLTHHLMPPLMTPSMLPHTFPGPSDQPIPSPFHCPTQQQEQQRQGHPTSCRHPTPPLRSLSAYSRQHLPQIPAHPRAAGDGIHTDSSTPAHPQSSL